MNWDIWFLGLARYISTASKDPSTKVGAVVIDMERRVVSTGYNGLPRGVEDSEERLSNRDLKYKLILHAEKNALLFAKQSLKGCSIYVWPMMPCVACASMIIQAGITRVIAAVNENPRWSGDFKLTADLFREANVNLEVIETDF